MALEFTDDGFISLEGRKGVFESGKPVNNPPWDSVKEALEMLGPTGHGEISERLVNETWNAIVDPYTGMVLSTPNEQFIKHCKRMGIVAYRSTENPDIFQLIKEKL